MKLLVWYWFIFQEKKVYLVCDFWHRVGTKSFGFDTMVELELFPFLLLPDLSGEVIEVLSFCPVELPPKLQKHFSKTKVY